VAILSSHCLPVALTLAAIAAFGCGGEDEDPPRPTARAGPSTAGERTHPPSRGESASDARPGEGRSGDDRLAQDAGEGTGRDERSGTEGEGHPADLVLAAARRYVAALSSRDGARVCAILAPGALAEVPLPRERGGCAASLDASIGYRDPRGLPVFEDAEVSSATVEARGARARVVATIVTRFADRSQPSFEDDIVYLERRNRGWLIAKASSVLYRAVGIADVPPSAIAPP
jgi:hypothetical protein